MIPILYSPSEQNFTSRGLGALSDAISCVVTEERNGQFELVMTYPVTGVNFDYISDRSIIVAIPSPYRQAEPFRIYEIESPLNGIVTIHARHVSYDLSGVALEPYTASDVSSALDGFASHSLSANPFTFYTDKSTNGTFTVEVPSSVRQVMGGQEGSILDVFGGEWEFNRFDVHLWETRGQERSLRIAYARNLTGFNMTRNMETMFTGIYPYWTDGETVVEVSGKVITVLVADYENIAPIDFSDKFEETPTPAQLQSVAEDYISSHDFGVPKVSFDVSFIDLASTTEYEAFAELEAVDLCDTVTVVFPMYGIESSAKIVKIETNVLLERYNKVTIGTIQTTIADTIASLQGGTSVSSIGGGGGTSNYNLLTNKPSINGVELIGDKTTSQLGIPVYTAGDNVQIEDTTINARMPYAQVDSTSTATAYTATVPNITALKTGVFCYLYNGRITSAAGATLDVNGLGAKPIYNSFSGDAITTTFNIERTFLFVYDEDRIAGGCWDIYTGYYASNSDTLAYMVRHNYSSLPAADNFVRYRVLFTNKDNTLYIPSTTSTSTNATSLRAVNQRPIDPFGQILYYGTTAAVSAGGRPSPASLWQQHTITLGYAFNRRGAALTLTPWDPIYIKCAPQADGTAIIDADEPFVQSLPSSDDGKIYIFFGIAYNATTVEMLLDHPVYCYKNGAIRHWDPSGFSIRYGTTAEWAYSAYIPSEGEVIVYTDYQTIDGDPVAGIKIGTGNAYVQDLQFIDAELRDRVMNHINNSTIHVTSAEKTFWGNKINIDDAYEIVNGNLQNETLVFTRS